MKKYLLKYLFFGFLGGLSMFLLDLYDLYYSTNGWFYFLVFILIVLIPMLINKLRNRQDNSFSQLFKLGFAVALFSLIFKQIISNLYPILFISEEYKIKLVDEKVNRLIMNYEGNKIDIFQLENQALSFFDKEMVEEIVASFAIFALYLLAIVFFALILKTKSSDLQEVDAH